jgi:hypothetical protein
LSISVSTLSVGQHTITLSAEDSEGDTAEAQITIEITAPPFSVSIESPATGSQFAAGEMIQFTGSHMGGQEPVTYTWSSSISGPFGQEQTVSASTLDDGQHTITLSGTDATSAVAEAQITIEVIALELPKIAPVEGQQIYAHIPYESAPPILEQGTGPITWSLVDSPDPRISIDPVTGVVSWSAPVIRPTPYQITIRAENEGGYDQVSWELTVVAGYTATVQAHVDVAPAGTPVNFSGQANRLDNGEPVGNVEVAIRIDVKGTRRTITTETDGSGLFSVVWQPLAREAGLYSVSADHPAVEDDAVEDQFILLGLAVEPGTVEHRVVAGQRIDANATIRNLADVELTGLSAQLENVPANLTVILGDYPETLGPEAEFVVEYAIEAIDASTLDAEIDLVLSSDGGATAKLRMSIAVTPANAALTASPTPITAGMVRGEQTLVEFTVTNSGGAPTGDLEVQLPDAAWLSLATPARISAIGPAEEVTVVLLLSPAESMLLGPYHGSLVVAGTTEGVEIPFHFDCISEGIGALRITAVDEFTFYADGEPKVAGAEVTLADPHTGELVTSGVTDDNGEVIFPDLIEAYYDIEIRADRHGGFRTTVLIPAGRTTDITAFLPRHLVSYRWTVVPTTIEDHYDFIIEAVFETDVPAPVVTVDPLVVDLRRMEGETMQVDYTFTNHGLITANELSLHFEDNPRYDFEPLVGQIGDIPAQSSVVVPVLITDRSKIEGTVYAESPEHCEGSDPFGLYYILCGGESYRRVPFHYITDGGSTFHTMVPSYGPYAYGPPTSVDNPGGGGGGGGRVWLPGVVGPTYSLGSRSICDNDCFWDFADCAAGIVGIALPSFGVANSILECMAACLAGESADCVTQCMTELLGIDPVLGRIPSLFSCLNAILSCSGLADTRGDIGVLQDGRGYIASLSQLESQTDSPAAAPLEEHMHRLQTILDPIIEILGDPKWLYPDEGAGFDSMEFEYWITQFRASVSPDSEEGYVISAAEQVHLLGDAVPSHVTIEDAHGAIDRWNRTMDYWDTGIFNASEVPQGGSLDFIEHDRLQAKLVEAKSMEDLNISEGFTGFFNGINWSLAHLYEATEEELGVCVQVRIRIDQAAVMSRDAFTATLELLNESEASALEQINVSVNINDQYGNPSDHLFGLHPPVLSGIDDIDGGGTLPAATSGTAQWLIVPTSAAAPDEPTLYYVSGELSYVSDGDMVRIPLYPTPITVLPNPSLDVKYFLERDVYSDDPFTDDVIEPAIPFSLGLMMSNTGAGTAGNVEITSSQPKIIDNEKGLLVDFQIIGTSVGPDAVSPGLSVELGDIEPSESKVARWAMISSLQGEFVEYDANFVHVDGLGDKRLSLVDSVEIHELEHVVRAEYPADDMIPDFLTNDIEDLDDLPDTLHLSDGSVAAMLNAIVDGIVTPVDLEIALVVPDMPDGWVYLRIPDPGQNRFKLASVKRADGTTIRIGENAWITHRVVRKQGEEPYEENFLHLFDFGGLGTYVLEYVAQDVGNPVVQIFTIYHVTEPGTFTVPLQVTYSDNVALDATSFDSQDIVVIGPWGFEASARFKVADTPGDGTPRAATYVVDAPGGSWDELDNGTYSIWLQPNQVSDTIGNSVAEGLISNSVN